MDKHPIRRKFIDNPYILSSSTKDDLYIISFYDSKGLLQEIKVNKEIYDLFDEKEKCENAEFCNYSRYFTHSDISFEKVPSNYSLEEDVLNKITSKELKEILNQLPLIQKNRIIKYYFYDMTLEEIAKEEGCTKRAVKFSIDIALEKILQKFKN